jgi:hypothetical protein
MTEVSKPAGHCGGGWIVGLGVGDSDGCGEGAPVGNILGADVVGPTVGAAVGEAVGLLIVGANVGRVGNTRQRGATGSTAEAK